MAPLTFMNFASGTDFLHTSLERCSLSGGSTIPHSWNCSRSGWMMPWASWPGEWPLCPWQGDSNSVILRCLPTQAFLWFYNSEAGVQTGQKSGAGGAQGCRAGKDPAWHCPSGWGDDEPPKSFVGTLWIQSWDTHLVRRFGVSKAAEQLMSHSVTRQRKRKVFGHAGELTDQETIELHQLWQL